MPTEEQSFQQLLVELKRKAGWNPARADNATATTALRQMSKFLGIKINNIETIVRGDASGKYYLHRQLAKNHRWLTDLTGWTEVLEAGITATTARDTMDLGRRESAYTHVPLKIDVTGSTGANLEASRYFRFPAVQNDIFSTEVWVTFADAINCKIISRIDYLDAGFASLTSHDTERTTATSTYVQLLNENRTATNASTAWIELKLMVESTASGADGTAHFSVPILEKRTSISTEAQRCILGASALR